MILESVETFAKIAAWIVIGLISVGMVFALVFAGMYIIEIVKDRKKRK